MKNNRLFKILYYILEKGKVTANELSDKQRAKTIRDLKILELYGNRLREPQSKYLEDGIYELRTKQGSNISRILYFFFVGRRIVLTNGFVKKSMKTPKSAIELAIKYKNNYLNSINKYAVIKYSC